MYIYFNNTNKKLNASIQFTATKPIGIKIENLVSNQNYKIKSDACAQLQYIAMLALMFKPCSDCALLIKTCRHLLCYSLCCVSAYKRIGAADSITQSGIWRANRNEHLFSSNFCVAI